MVLFMKQIFASFDSIYFTFNNFQIKLNIVSDNYIDIIQ